MLYQCYHMNISLSLTHTHLNKLKQKNQCKPASKENTKPTSTELEKSGPGTI